MQLPLFPLVPVLSHSARMSSSGCASVEVSGTAGAMVKNASIAMEEEEDGRRGESEGGWKASRCVFDVLLFVERGLYLYCRDGCKTAQATGSRKGSPHKCSRSSRHESVPVGRRNLCNVECLTIRRVGPSVHRGGAQSRTAWRTRRRRGGVPCTLIPYTVSRGQGDRTCCVGAIGGCSWQYLSIRHFSLYGTCYCELSVAGEGRDGWGAGRSPRLLPDLFTIRGLGRTLGHIDALFPAALRAGR